MGMYYVRVIRIEGGLMVSIADEEVMGKAAVDEESGVRIIVSREFYGGDLVDDDRVEELMREASVLVLAGRRVIKKAIDMGLVNPDSVLEIKGLQHVQVFKFSY
ncbi:MAG: DUF424 family protein [Desulfurococcales archaeon]|nr:DUF424 family protein [Desulfurococcales archaeon]